MSEKKIVYLAALYLLLSEIVLSAMGAIVKVIGDSLDMWQVLFFRNLCVFILIVPYTLKKSHFSLNRKNIKAHAFRGVSGVVATYFFFLSLTKIPYAEAMFVILMSPFIVPVISFFFFKEQHSKYTILAMILAFFGFFIALSPDDVSDKLYVSLAFLGAVIVAVNQLIIRNYLTDEPSNNIVVIAAFFGLLCSSIPSFLVWKSVSLFQFSLLMLLGLLAAMAQILMTKAFQMTSPSRISIISNTSIFFAAALGYVFWDEPITMTIVIGTFLIAWASNISISQSFFGRSHISSKRSESTYE